MALSIPTLERVVKMHEEGMYTGLTSFLGMILDEEGPADDSKVSSRSHSSSSLDANHETQAYLIFADALFHSGDYRRCEKILTRVLNCRKSYLLTTTHPSAATRSSSSRRNQVAGMTEQDVRFQLHQCRVYLNKHLEAISVLEDIPVESRSSRVHLALGNLYCKEKKKSEAIKSLKEVIKENPLAFDAITLLLKFGVKATDIVSVIGPQIVSNCPEQDWIFCWVDAESSLHSFKTEKTIELVKKLVSRHPSSPDKNEGNKDLVVLLGRAFYYNGDYKKAISVMKSLYSKDVSFVKGLDCYAACLYRENDVRSLEELTNRMITRCEAGLEERPEPWIVLGYYSFMNYKKDTKCPMYFSRKAYMCSSSGLDREDNLVESLLLQGKIFAEIKSPSEALSFLIEAHNLSPHRFEVIQSLTDVYLMDKKHSLAVSVASNALKHFGQTPRSLTLYARTLLSDCEDSKKGVVSERNRKLAKTHLERAVLKDRSYLKAVYSLAELYMEEKMFTRTIDLINKCLEVENTNKLHRLLGECYHGVGDAARAEHHLNVAKKLEVTYRSSTEAAQSLNTSAHHDHHSSSSRSASGHGSGTPVNAGGSPVGHAVDLIEVPDSEEEQDMDYGDNEHPSSPDYS